MTEFRSAYGPKVRSGIDASQDGVVKQSFKKECDINYIVQRYRNDGVLPKVAALEAIYGDVTGLDFQAALDLVKGAEDAFMGLPAAVRKRFDNDPGSFLTFCDDPANVAELVELGLATPREAAELAQGVSGSGSGAVPAPEAAGDSGAAE